MSRMKPITERLKIVERMSLGQFFGHELPCEIPLASGEQQIGGLVFISHGIDREKASFALRTEAHDDGSEDLDGLVISRGLFCFSHWSSLRGKGEVGVADERGNRGAPGPELCQSTTARVSLSIFDMSICA